MNNNFDASLMDHMFSNAYKLHRSNLENKQPEIIDDLDEKTAILVANEMLEVLIKHNLSYKNSYRISLAVTTALAEGGVELYKNENR